MNETENDMTSGIKENYSRLEVIATSVVDECKKANVDYICFFCTEAYPDSTIEGQQTNLAMFAMNATEQFRFEMAKNIVNKLDNYEFLYKLKCLIEEKL